MIFDSFNPEETYNIGKDLGEKAQPGDVYLLFGDLGVGKTLFSQGFAKELGIMEHVNSPTFTIVQEYTDGRLPFYHFDVYRIADEEEMEEIGFQDMIFGEGVCLIEWANLIQGILPDNCHEIRIEKDNSRGFEYRKISIQKGN